MWHVRMVRHPALAAEIPMREICHAAAACGSAIMAAAARRGSSRQRAFAALAEGWRDIQGRDMPTPIPSGPATLRYLGFEAPHQDDDVPHEGSTVLVAAVPDTSPTEPWRLASERLTRQAPVRLDLPAFDGVQQVGREADALAISDVLAINVLRNDS
jgi:hypothetical protein